MNNLLFREWRSFGWSYLQYFDFHKIQNTRYIHNHSTIQCWISRKTNLICK